MAEIQGLREIARRVKEARKDIHNPQTNSHFGEMGKDLTQCSPAAQQELKPLIFAIVKKTKEIWVTLPPFIFLSFFEQIGSSAPLFFLTS